MRHKQPPPQDAYWDGYDPSIGARKSPYRTDSNVNFLLDTGDFYRKKTVPASLRLANMDNNQLVQTNDLELIRKSIERIKLEKKIKDLAKEFLRKKTVKVKYVEPHLGPKFHRTIRKKLIANEDQVESIDYHRKCNQGHLLQYLEPGQNQNQPLKCNGCGNAKSNLIQMGMWYCEQCSFYLCRECAGLRKNAEPESASDKQSEKDLALNNGKGTRLSIVTFNDQAGESFENAGLKQGMYKTQKFPSIKPESSMNQTIDEQLQGSFGLDLQLQNFSQAFREVQQQVNQDSELSQLKPQKLNTIIGKPKQLQKILKQQKTLDIQGIQHQTTLRNQKHNHGKYFEDDILQNSQSNSEYEQSLKGVELRARHYSQHAIERNITSQQYARREQPAGEGVNVQVICQTLGRGAGNNRDLPLTRQFQKRSELPEISKVAHNLNIDLRPGNTAQSSIQEIKKQRKQQEETTNQNILDQGDSVLVDGRKIKKHAYPEGFNFNLIKKCKKEGNDPLVNFNNLVMEQHIVDVNQIKSIAPFDMNRMYGEKLHSVYKDVDTVQFSNQQVHINNQQLLESGLNQVIEEDCSRLGSARKEAIDYSNSNPSTFRSTAPFFNRSHLNQTSRNHSNGTSIFSSRRATLPVKRNSPRPQFNLPYPQRAQSTLSSDYKNFSPQRITHKIMYDTHNYWSACKYVSNQ